MPHMRITRKVDPFYSLYFKLMSSGRESPDSGKSGTGFILQKKTGEWVKKGESLVEAHIESTTHSTWIDD